MPTITNPDGTPAVLTPDEQAEVLRLASEQAKPVRLVDPYKPVQYKSEDGQPVTPQERAEIRKAAGIADPLLDLSSEEMADLARQSPEKFNILMAFQSRPDVKEDPEAVKRVAAGWKAYRDKTGITDLNIANIPGNIWGMVKGAYEYGKDMPQPVGKAPLETVKGILEWGKALDSGDLTPEQVEKLRGFTENVYATSLSLEGMARLAKSAMGKLSEEERKFKLPGIPSLGAGGKPEAQRDVEKLFEDEALLESTQKMVTGERELVPGLNRLTEYLKERGAPIRPQKVEEKAAGDPLTFYLFGKVFGAASKAAPTVLSEKMLAQAGAKTATGVGATVEALGKAGKAVIPPVAKVLPAASAVKGGILGGSLGSPTAGVVAGYAAGKTAAAGLMKRLPTMEGLQAAGRQIAGKEAPTGWVSQLVKDVAESAPGAAYEVGKGLTADVAMTLPAETPEEMQGVGLGAAFGLFGGGMRMGSHVLSGQIIGPRAQAFKTAVPARGLFPGLDTLSNQAYAGAPEGVQVRLNALRALLQSAFDNADTVYIPRPPEGAPDPAVPALMQLRDQKGNPIFTEEQAKVWANAQGLMSQDVGGKRLVFFRDIEAAPHEVSGHGIEAVLGESAMRQIDAMIQSDPKYARNWDALAQDYVSRFPEWRGTPWQDFLLQVTQRGAAEAKEKLIRDRIGEGPYTKDQASTLWADWVSRAEGATPAEKEINAVRSILTPEEFSDAANRAYAREVFAENAATSFEHGTAPDPRIAAKIAQTVGNFVRYMGGDPLAGRVSKTLGLPLSLDVIEAHRGASQKLASGARPVLEVPPVKKAGVARPGGIPTTPEEQQDAAAKAGEYAQEAPDKIVAVGGTQTAREILGIIAEAIAQRTGLKLNKQSAPGQPAASTLSNRKARREAQAAFDSMAPETRALWEKNYFPERVVKLADGRFQIIGWSPETFAANAHKTALAISDMAAIDPKYASLSPFPIDPKTGSFTTEGWKQLYERTQTFVQNQMAGRTGSGLPLSVPKEMVEAGVFAPKLEAGVPLDQAQADFISALYNFKLPKTARVTSGKMPLSIVGEEVSEATLPGRTSSPVVPKGAEPRPAFEGPQAEAMGIEGREITEVNPFRNELQTAANETGVPMPSMIETIQRVNLPNILSAEHAPELPQFRGNTLTLTAGFLPSNEPGALRAAAVRDTATGKDFIAPWHASAWAQFHDAKSRGPGVEGFVTNKGEFLDRDQATQRAIEMKQIEDVPMVAESAKAKGLGVEHVKLSEMTGGGWGTKPPSEAVKGLINDIHSTNPEQWQQLVQSPEKRGKSSYPHEVGMQVKSPADLQLLRSTHDMMGDLIKAAMEAKEPEIARSYALKRQAVREAYESATGKTMDGKEDMTETLRSFYGEDYEPPSAQFLSRKDEVKFTQDDERNSFFTLGDSILEVEHTPDWKQVWGKTLYVPTAERMRGVGPALIEAVFDKIPQGGTYNPGEVIGAQAESQARYLRRLSEQTGVKLGEMNVNPQAQFAPSQEPRAIKNAAVFDPETGEKYEGRMHFMARQAALQAGLKPMDMARLQDGFVTNEGEFLTRDEALTRGREFNQVSPSVGETLRSEDLQSQFAPLETTKDEIGFFPIGYKSAERPLGLLTEAARKATGMKIVPHGDRGFRDIYAFGPKGEDLGSAFSQQVNPKEVVVRTVRGSPEVQELLRAELEAQIKADGLQLAAPEAQFAPKKEWELKRPGMEGFSKAWILPDGTPVQLGGQLHHEWVDQNAAIRKKYGLPKTDSGADNRVVALRKGFARINYATNGGKLTVEARARDWPDLREPVKRLIEANLGKIDNITVTLLDARAKLEVDSGSQQLFKMSPEQKMENLPLISAPGEATEVSVQATPREDWWEQVTGLSGQFTPAKLEDFGKEETLPAALSKTGWAVLSATQESIGPATAPANVEANKKLAAALDEGGYPYQKITGTYKGIDQGESFLVTGITPQEALALGQQFKQESVLVPEGLLYSDNTLAPAKSEGTLVGAPAKEQEFFSTTESGVPFSLGIDFEKKLPFGSAKQEELIPAEGKKGLLSNVQVAGMTRAELNEYYPEAVIPPSRNAEIPSNIRNSPLAKKAGSEAKAIQAFADKLVEFAQKFKDHPAYQSGLRWYSDFVPKVKAMFGADAPMFVELLAGTSPQQRPKQNFEMAEEALKNFKAGKYDRQIKKFEEGLEKIKDGSWETWIADEIKSGAVKKPPAKATESTFINHWYEKFDLAPRKANGALYGMSSKAVLKVMARTWLESNAGLKVNQFVGNLLGTSHEATIDLWADRTMRRLGYEGFRERWRILPLNTSPVTDPDFRFSQKAFRAAADKLGVLPDALQGGLWFAEKQLWHDNGWSPLDLGDYREEIARRELQQQQPAPVEEAPELPGLIEPRPSAQFMYGLDEIVRMNEKAAARAKQPKVRSTTDHSSYTGNAERGVVLHSGAHRETQFLEGREAREFLKKAIGLAGQQNKLDRLIESRF